MWVLFFLPNTEADTEAVALVMACPPRQTQKSHFRCPTGEWSVVSRFPKSRGCGVSGESPGTGVLIWTCGFWGESWFVLKTATASHLALWDLPANPLFAGEPGWILTPGTSSSENHCKLLTRQLTPPQLVIPAALAPGAAARLSKQAQMRQCSQYTLDTRCPCPASTQLWPQLLPLPSISHPRRLRAQHAPQLGPFVYQQTLPISL